MGSRAPLATAAIKATAIVTRSRLSAVLVVRERGVYEEGRKMIPPMCPLLWAMWTTHKQHMGSPHAVQSMRSFVALESPMPT